MCFLVRFDGKWGFRNTRRFGGRVMTELEFKVFQASPVSSPHVSPAGWSSGGIGLIQRAQLRGLNHPESGLFHVEQSLTVSRQTHGDARVLAATTSYSQECVARVARRPRWKSCWESVHFEAKCSTWNNCRT